jgi:TetR/AcrR family transcriptional regulator, transcriptional repressor of bet genes
MPRIVDHEERRRHIALSACRTLARRGVERTTMADIAREANVTTGMITHYYDNKRDIIAAALRLVLERAEQRMDALLQDGEDRLYSVLKETLPIDSARRDECAVWVSFWGRVTSDAKLAAVNRDVHAHALDLYGRVIRAAWQEADAWRGEVFDAVHTSILNFLNGLTASAVTSPQDWPVDRQLASLRLHLSMIRRWAHEQD